MDLERETKWRMKTTQILGAPVFFSTVWSWIKRWFDPVTVSKIFILSQHEVLPVLSSFIDIKNIPKQYGGELDFEWCQMPNLDPKIKELATWENGFTEFPKGPMYWVPTEEGKTIEALARGTVDQKERNIKVCSIPVAFPPVHEKTEEVATNGEAVVSVGDSAKEIPSSPASPTNEEFKDAPEGPLKVEPPAVTEIQGVQNLSLKDPDDEPFLSEKAAAAEPLPNRKAEAAS